MTEEELIRTGLLGKALRDDSPACHPDDLIARISASAVPLFRTPIWDLVLIILGMECLLAEGK